MPSYSQAIWSLVLRQSQNVIDVSFYYITQCPQGIVAMIGRRWKPATATKLEPAMDLIMLPFLFAPDILFPSCHFHFGLLCCYKTPQFPKGKKNRQTDFLFNVCVLSRRQFWISKINFEIINVIKLSNNGWAICPMCLGNSESDWWSKKTCP